MHHPARIVFALAAAGAAMSAQAVDDVPMSVQHAIAPEPLVMSMSMQPEAADALRHKVLVHCGLDGSRDTLPWYFHFEYGRALLQAGDARRAVPELARAVSINPLPRADKRLYGMWFTDYLPYFQLAEAHARLDNWPCAGQALQLSRTSGETGMGRLDPERVRALQEQVDANSGRTGACTPHDTIDGRMAGAESNL